MLYYIPLEKLPERYTESWYYNIIKHFFENDYEYQVIEGTSLTTSVEVGTFLDINSTAYFKATQLQEISKLFHNKAIKDGDIFFVADIEFWGIETIKVLADLQNIKIKLIGFCHAASYTYEDFMEPCADYHKYFELGWFKVFDKIFVGTEYHKQAIIDRRIKPYVSSISEQCNLMNKIDVSGNPIFYSDYKYVLSQQLPKKNQLIISNRFDWEKRPNLSLDFAYLLKRRNPDLNIILTTSRPTFKSNKNWLVDYARNLEKDGILTIYENCSKEQYHTHLAESKVFLSNTIEENFGFCLLEAIIFNVYPVVENKYSHPELLDNKKLFLFNDTDEIIPKVEYLLTYNEDISWLSKRYYTSFWNKFKSAINY